MHVHSIPSPSLSLYLIACKHLICVESHAFAVIQRSCATSYYTFAHENGHILGYEHNRVVDYDERSYSYGWQDPQERFQTIMSYECENNPCGKIQAFSGPNLTFYMVI
jgi:hypothetical protein